MTPKERYRRLCEAEATIPLFSQAWWLDAVAGDASWDVCLAENDGVIQASMPYVMKTTKLGFRFLVQPPLTQNLGPWLRASDFRIAKKLAREKDLLEALIGQLPRYDYFSQNLHYVNTNWLPFYWAGFKQTTRYTYVIEDLSDLDRVFSGFEYAKRKNIRKANQVVRVVFDLDADAFYDNHVLTLGKQGAQISYSRDLFRRIYSAAYRKGAGKTIAAFDADGNLHAALFVVRDRLSAYDLISTIDPDYRRFGAASLLVMEIIRHMSTHVNRFDFEGSMIESVERSFRQFGAKQMPYFSVSRAPSRLVRGAMCIREVLR